MSTKKTGAKASGSADEPADRVKARLRQELRRSNAAVPIPSGRHKRGRSWQKQRLRDEIR